MLQYSFDQDCNKISRFNKELLKIIIILKKTKTLDVGWSPEDKNSNFSWLIYVFHDIIVVYLQSWSMEASREGLRRER